MNDCPFDPLNPAIRVCGEIEDETVNAFWNQMQKALQSGGAGPLVIEVTTGGGDAEAGRRIAMDIKLLRAKTKRAVYILGKTHVYSAGVTILAAVPPENRWLTEDAVLLVHERKMTEDITFDGPLQRVIDQAHDIIAQCEIGQKLEREGFADFARGSAVTLDQVTERAGRQWYIPAAEALEMRLVAGLCRP